MNAFPDRSALERAETLLSAPVRMCGVAHENAARDGEGKALFDGYDLEDEGEERRELDVMILPECAPERKHLGCAHFRALHGKALAAGLDALAVADPDAGPLAAELLALQDAQAALDERVRVARLGSKENILADRIPDAEAAERDAAPHVREFHANCRRIEDVRVLLLAKVRAALGR